MRRSAVSKFGYACKYLAVLLAWLAAALALLLFDENLCYVSGKYHRVVLNRTQTAVDPDPKALLSPGPLPSPYNGASDVVLDEEIQWPEDGETTPDKFPLSILVNETTYRSQLGSYTSMLEVLTLTTPQNDTSQRAQNIVIETEVPTRKRVRLEYPWFSFGYWTGAGTEDACRPESGANPNSTVPVWVVNPSAAGRGRADDTLCLSDYNLSVSIPSEGFCAGPLVFRALEWPDTRVRLDGLQSSGIVVLDLFGQNQSLEFSGILDAHVLTTALADTLQIRVKSGATGSVDFALAGT